MHRWVDYMNASYSFYGSPFFHIHSNSQHWCTLLSTLVVIVFWASNSPRNCLCKSIFPTFPHSVMFCTCNKKIKPCSFRNQKAPGAEIESFLSSQVPDSLRKGRSSPEIQENEIPILHILDSPKDLHFLNQTSLW